MRNEIEEARAEAREELQRVAENMETTEDAYWRTLEAAWERYGKYL